MTKVFTRNVKRGYKMCYIVWVPTTHRPKLEQFYTIIPMKKNLPLGNRSIGHLQQLERSCW